MAGVCVVHRDRDRIVEDMPNIVRLWYRRNRGIEVEVFSGAPRQEDDTYSIPAMAMPSAVAAQQLGR